MKKVLFILIASISITYISSCKKNSDSPDSPDAPSTFTAYVNGKATTFKLSQATLLRGDGANIKKMNITGVSSDSTQRLVFTLAVQTSKGNGMPVKSFILNPFPIDDPNTPQDESLNTDGFSTWSTKVGNNDWNTVIYLEDGLFNITSCDSIHTILTGTFHTVLTDINTHVIIENITDGRLVNAKYTVLN